ncbi:MAG: hypothetical protein PUE21_02080 [Lachnospiraceae bacterium]|nr:hypothetical protein [Lachnospiraceae bacterium]
MSNKAFYQDFLFADMNVTKEGYPNIEFEYCNHVADYKIMKLGCNQKDKKLLVMLTDLMSVTEEDRWKKLEKKVAGLDELVIVDDIELKNQELEDYKCFFIKSYLWRLSKICQCQVTQRLCHD